MSTWFRSKQHSVIFVRITMEDLSSKILDAPWAKFFRFHAVLEEIWQNCMLAAPEVGATTSVKFWSATE